jgi:glycosyltransferase involved in cell wall biosynthesis
MPDTASKTARRSICVIAEGLSLPVDEGIKHFAVSLVEGWSKAHRVLGISTRSEGPMAPPHTIGLKTNKCFFSSRLFSVIRRFKPELICYVPSASATVFSFLRAKMLKIYYPGASVVMVSLQPRSYGWFSRRVVALLAPDEIFVQYEQSLRQLLDLGCHTKLLASGVDLNKFTPVSSKKKGELRQKYGLDPAAFTVLHVGHITGGRNIDFLAELRRKGTPQVILVGSSLVHPDRSVISARLKEQGVIIFDNYFQEIQEIYQLSDCYLFPVISDRSCIGTPLSVLEAMACNLPVVSLRYGLLPRLFDEGQGLFFADTPGELVERVLSAGNMNGNCHTREKAAAYSWENIAGEILKQSVTHEEKHS